MTIAASDAPAQIAIQLEFIESLEATNTATFTFTLAGDTTKVPRGADFERGLASLKSVAESAPRGDTQAAK